MLKLIQTSLVILITLFGTVSIAGAQGPSKPTYVIAFIPMKWTGGLDGFDRAATQQANIFISESGIDKYARVEVRLVHDRLDNVDLTSFDLVPVVVEFGLRRAPADRYVGLTNGNLAPRGQSSVVGYTDGPNSNGSVVEAVDDAITAHELGHTFGLCDEYSFAAWERENLYWGCPNPYPPDCPKTASVDCEGNRTLHGGRCIMGPAGLYVRREFDSVDLTYLDKIFAQMFGTRQPTPTPGPTPTRLPEPIPQTLAFINNSTGAYQLYIGQIDKSAPHPIANVRGEVFTPGWSPDGKQFAFASSIEGNLQIYTMSIDGTNLRRLTNNAARNESPAWSPDGKYLAFVSDREGSQQIYVMRSDGTDVTRLTDSPGHYSTPIWSPDKNRLAFASDRDGRFQIYVLNLSLDNGIRVQGTTRLTNSGAADISPGWSPDGKDIAFASNRDGNFEIYVMSADGNGVRRLTMNLYNDWNPTWLKGQEWLAFQTARDGSMQVFMIHVASGFERCLFQLDGNSAEPAAQR